MEQRLTPVPLPIVWINHVSAPGVRREVYIRMIVVPITYIQKCIKRVAHVAAVMIDREEIGMDNLQTMGKIRQ